MLIKLLSIFRNVFNAKAKEINPSEQNEKMQNLKVEFESLFQKAEEQESKRVNSNPSRNGFESHFQCVQKMSRRRPNSNPSYFGFESQF